MSCKHEKTISAVVEGLSDMRRCTDCGETFSGRELAQLQKKKDLAAANDLALGMHMEKYRVGE